MIFFGSVIHLLFPSWIDMKKDQVEGNFFPGLFPTVWSMSIQTTCVVSFSHFLVCTNIYQCLLFSPVFIGMITCYVHCCVICAFMTSCFWEKNEKYGTEQKPVTFFTGNWHRVERQCVLNIKQTVLRWFIRTRSHAVVQDPVWFTIVFWSNDMFWSCSSQRVSGHCTTNG